MQVGDGLTGPGLERILDAERADDLAVDRQIQRRQALHLGLDLLLNVGIELRTLVLKHKVRGTDDGATPFDGRSDAVRHDVLNGGMALAALEPTLASSVDDCARCQVGEMLLQAGRKAQDLVLAPAVGRQHASQARLRELTEGGAQKCDVTGHDKHRTQGRGQKPSARTVGAKKCGKIHDELVLAWLKLHHVTRLCVGNGLGIERTDGGQHGIAVRLIIFERHLANTAINAHLVHAVDIAAKLKKCIEITFWHRTRQLKTGPAGDLAHNRESHSLCLGALLGCLVSSGLALGDLGRLGNHVVDISLGLLDHVLVAVLDAHAARDTLHAGILYRSAGKQLDAGRAKQKTATDKQGIERRPLHVASPFCRIGRGTVPQHPSKQVCFSTLLENSLVHLTIKVNKG